MKISILTPSFNSASYIERAIQSVLNQNYDNWEHIIIDGGSTDGTLDILQKYPHLKWVSEPDKGQSDAMNKAFRMSTGDIIIYLNADDEFEYGIFKTIINEFLVNPNHVFVFGNLVRVLKDGQRIISKPHQHLMSILSYLPNKFPLNPVSYFYKREVQEKVGLFPVDNHYTMDYWFLLRVYQKFPVQYIDKVFGYFYYDSNKSTNVEIARHQLKIVRNQFLKNNIFIMFKYIYIQTRKLLKRI